MAGLGYQYVFNTGLLIGAAAGSGATPPTYSQFGHDILYLNPSDWGAGSPSVYLEVIWKTSASTGYARLYNSTTAGAIGSAITTTSTSVERTRSSALTLTASDNEYIVQFGAVTGTATVTMYSAKLIIDAS